MTRFFLIDIFVTSKIGSVVDVLQVFAAAVDCQLNVFPVVDHCVFLLNMGLCWIEGRLAADAVEQLTVLGHHDKQILLHNK